jgi:hypothetical protein
MIEARHGGLPPHIGRCKNQAMPKGQEIKVGRRRFPSIMQAAIAYGLTESAVRARIKRMGWTIEEALGLKAPPYRKRVQVEIRVRTPRGMRQFVSVNAAAKAFGQKPSSVQRRLKVGWTPEQSLGLHPPPKRKGRPSTLTPEERRERKKQYDRNYAEKHRAQLRAYSRNYHAARMGSETYREYHRSRTERWRKEHPERVKAIQRKHRAGLTEEERSRRREYKRQLYHADIEHSRALARKWRTANRDRAIARARAYVASLPPEKREYYREKQREWRQRNKEYRRELSKTPQAKATRRRYLRRRWRDDPQHKLGLILRNRLNKAISGQAKAGSAVRHLGCTIEELREHLESLFQDGMGWDNWGVGPGTWQIDHISPLALHDLTDPEQLSLVCHWSNLMPTWHEDHAKKTVADTAKIRRKKLSR